MSSLFRRSINLTFLLVALLTATQSLWGAPTQQGERGLRSITLSHGLSDLLVNTIYRDNHGYIWFGTEGSLDRFDGNRIVRFPIGGDPQKSRRVLAITEGKNCSIYVGTAQGLFVLPKRGSELRRLLPEQIDFRVTSFAHGKEGDIYIGTSHGLFVYNDKTRKLTHKLLVNDNLSAENDIIGLEMLADRQLYILTPRKLWVMTLPSGNMTALTLPVRHKATLVDFMGKTLYIGTEGDGVLPYDTSTGKFLPAFRLGNGVVTSISSDSEGNLVVSTDGEGIYRYSPAENKELGHLTYSPASEMQLRSNSVYSTLNEEKGRLWIGYYQSGADYTPLDHNIIEIYSNPIPGENAELAVRAFSVDGKGKALIGTPDGAILYDRNSGEIKKYSKPDLESNIIFTSAYNNGLFYFGTYHGGMYSANPSTGQLQRFGPPELSDASVFKIEIDPQGNLWAASSEGLYMFPKGKPERMQRFTSENSQLPQGNVYEIFFDSSGRGWICTENGVAVWNGKHLQTSGFPSGFINNMKIRTVFEDSDHNLYFAPDRGAIWKSDLALQNFGPLKIGAPDRFSQFTAIAEDNDGRLWIGTDKGLVRYEKNGHYDIFNNAGSSIHPAYTLSTPHKDEFGNIWMGSTSGLHKINVKEANAFHKQLEDYDLAFTGVFTNGQLIDDRLEENDGKLQLKLNSDESDITVHVSDFSFRYIDYFEIEYILEGIDEDWRWTDGNHPIEYRDLPQGTYTLRVREAGNPQSEITLTIKKKGTFQWGWAILALLIIITGASIWFFAFQRKAHQRLLDSLSTSGVSTLPREEEENGADEETESDRKQAAYRTTRLSDEECKRIYRKLEGMMKAEKPYTNPELKSKDLAEMTGTTAHALSFLFNQYLHKSYYDYVNEYRVAEFKRMVTETDISRYTLTTLAERCGFSSRASFFRHFKAITGQTPAEYLKQ